MADLPLQFKYIVIGCSGVGKTSIVRRLVDGKFMKGTQSTVGIEYFTHITAIEGRTVKMMIWDTAGQERFYTIARAYFRAAVGVVLVFDITDRKSFDQLPRWLRDARAEADPHCSVVLVGNKADQSGSRTVSREEGEEFARTHEMAYVETSAADGTGIQDVFAKTGTDLLRKAVGGLIGAGAPPTVGAPVSIAKRDGAKKQCGC